MKIDIKANRRRSSYRECGCIFGLCSKSRNGIEWSLSPDERYNVLKFRSAAAQTVDILTGNFFYH